MTPADLILEDVKIEDLKKGNVVLYGTRLWEVKDIYVILHKQTHMTTINIDLMINNEYQYVGFNKGHKFRRLNHPVLEDRYKELTSQ